MGANVDATTGSRYISARYHELRQAAARWDLSPGQIVALYLVLGTLALYASDVLLVRFVEDPATLGRLQAAKGGAEIVATAGLIYVLARGSRRSLRATNARLARQQEELQVLHRVLRHNLRHDVNIVHGYATSLAGSVDDPERRAWCANIVAGAERITHYTEQAAKINKVTADDDPIHVDLVDLARRAVDANEALDRAETVEVTVPDTAPVYAHPMLEAAVHELLTNAVEHHDGDHLTVTVAVDPGAGPTHWTELAVRDDGPGVPDQVRETIQQRGETQLLHLEGLGLWFVSWVTTVSDGGLLVDDRNGGGTEVRLRLPTADWGAPSVPRLPSTPVGSC